MGAETFAAVAVAGGVVKAYGQYEAGKESKKAYDYNAGIEEQQALETRTAAALNDFKKRKAVEYAVGAQQAGYAKAGVVTNTGSPLDVLTDSLSNAYLDIAIDDYNYEVAARQHESQAAMDRYTGKQTLRLSKIQAFSTVLESASNFGASQAKGGATKTTIGQ